MKRWTAVVGLVLGCLLAAGERPFVGALKAADDPNAYFNALVARADHWTSNSLRSQSLIDSVSSVKPNSWVTYDATQDAAKATIPPFMDVGLRIASVGSDRVTFNRALTTAEKNLFIQYRGLRIDNEVVTVMRWYTFGEQFPDDSSVLVARGQFGTAAAPHATGATALISQNNLLSYLNVPLGTEDGRRYLFTWDVRYDSSYLGTDIHPSAVGHKEFQFTSGNRSGVWLETRIRPDGIDGMGKVGLDRSQFVALIDSRYYGNEWGSAVRMPDPLQPQSARFYVRANKWTRFWWLVDQRANDYDLVTLWVADEDTNPVKIFNALPINTQGTTPSIRSWWLEQNTSYDLYRGATRDLVSYVRNFIALRDPGDVSPLLVRPLAGLPGSAPVDSPPTTSTGPAPPTNVRIVQP
jgi:hypothetical protein